MVEGLEKYGYYQDAMRVRHKWCQNCIDVYEQGVNGAENTKHALWEKYNVVNVGETAGDGFYGASVKGFGWSNAVFKAFTEHPNFFNVQES